MLRRTALLAMLVFTVVLSGCASGWRVETDVESFTSTPPAPLTPGSRYRFERLPSQQQAAQLAAQTRLETLTEAALAQVGLLRGEADAPYSVQVDLRLSQVVDPYTTYPYGYAPWPGSRWSGRFWAGRGWYPGPGSVGLGLRYDAPRTLRELTLVIRQQPAGTVVYETRARHDDYVRDEALTVGAMLQAALSGFPTPPPGPRRVVTDVRPAPQP